MRYYQAMRFDLISIFPEFFNGPLDYGIVRRARQSRLIETHIHDLRSFTPDRHRTVDDRPFGGGEGMVMKPEPLFAAVESLTGGQGAAVPHRTAIVLLSASGKLFRQQTARRFAALERIILLCGRYEGVDERVAEHLATDELCVGDFVLSGGEMPAAMIVDAVTRLTPGALGNQDSTVNESFSEARFASGAKAPDGEAAGSRPKPRPTNQAFPGDQAAPDNAYAKTHHVSGAMSPTLLDCPHYTRPPSFRNWDVPEVLLGGNHEEIRRWRRQKALEKTLRNRPDLIHGAAPQAE
ncbi:MAG: tRNA (guanosine(37)-N1)-methyltransferase TrmD [Candidatus Acidiferrales bacterium]